MGFQLRVLVESRGVIILRPSLARSGRAHFCASGSRCSRISPCSCGGIGGRIDGLLCSSWLSNSGDFRLHDVGGLFHRGSSSFHKFHMHGFAVLRL